MNQAYHQFKWMYEALWLLAAALITFAATHAIYGYIRTDFFVYLCVTSFLGFTYLRWILFPEHSPLMYSFWVKLVLVFVNIPFFMIVLRYFTAANEVFDSFNFSIENRPGQIMSAETPFPIFKQLKTVTTLASTTMLMAILMFELRAIHLIFKWRQVPQSMTS